MFRVDYDPMADRDFDGIVDFILDDLQSASALMHFEQMIDNAVYGVLANQPQAGSGLTCKSDSVRKFFAGQNYWVVYEVRDDLIMVLRVLHARKLTDWTKVDLPERP